MLPTSLQKTRLLVVIILLLVLGFVSISYSSYKASNKVLNHQIKKNELPLTIKNAYSEVQRDILPAVIISESMAQDSFLVDWVLGGEKDTQKITQYLAAIQKKFNTGTSFFISERTRNYYHPSGIFKQVKESDERDKWYFRVSALKKDFEINIDINTVNENQTTIFVNHRILSDNDEYLGAIGVGLPSDKVHNLIKFYQDNFNTQVYFSDKKGSILLHGDELQESTTLNNSQGLKEIASDILSRDSGSYTYKRNGETVFLESRFIPDLGWYLLVEQEVNPSTSIKMILWLSVLCCLLIAAIVIRLIFIIINDYKKHLKVMATTDELTGVNNRYGFNSVFDYAVASSVRNNADLSIALIDIDGFRDITNQHGDDVGDKILKKLSDVLTDNKGKSDLLCRWGFDQFLVVLPKRNSKEAKKIAEEVCSTVLTQTFVPERPDLSVVVSSGAVQLAEYESPETFIQRAEQALLNAKSVKRDTAEPS